VGNITVLQVGKNSSPVLLISGTAETTTYICVTSACSAIYLPEYSIWSHAAADEILPTQEALWVKIARQRSTQLVVRGRIPSHYPVEGPRRLGDYLGPSFGGTAKLDLYGLTSHRTFGQSANVGTRIETSSDQYDMNARPMITTDHSASSAVDKIIIVDEADALVTPIPSQDKGLALDGQTHHQLP
jgi:hypothetical protein